MTDKFFIRINERLFTAVNSRDLVLVESIGRYRKIIATGCSYLVSATLSQLEKQLPAANFCRVHRTYIVAVDKISSITADTVRILDREIPLSRSYYEELFRRVEVIR